MDGIETKIAKDMLKPAAGFVDALLAPKIEKVRKWSKEKELSSYMKEDKLLSLLDNYLTRTIKRASFLSTVVFPQDRIPLDSVYEPVYCVKKGDDLYEKNGKENFVIDIDRKGGCYLIIDDAGMGKSTFSKHLCLKVIGETEKIPVLFELSEYDGNKSLLDNLASMFDEIGNEFSRDLFTKLLLIGRLFLVLDGFDEVPSETQDRLRSELIDLNDKKGDATLVVTSRPKDRIPNLIDSISLKLKRLTKEQALAMFDRYDSFSGLTIGERLSKEVENIPERFLETPLLVGLLYRTYGFNNSIAEKISVFYCEIYEALYKGHDLTKSGFIREKSSQLDIDEFRQLFRAFSFLFIAKFNDEKSAIDSFVLLADEAQKLCSFPPINSRKYIDDLLLAVPLLTKEGNSYKFIHRSIAEYYAAEFIGRSDNKKNLLENLVSNNHREQFSEVIEYIYEIDPILYREIISLPIANKYLEEYSSENFSPLFSTTRFSNNSAISFWRQSEVEEEMEDGRKTINLPRPIGSSYSGTSFMYGVVEGERYVAAITSSRSKDNHIPDGAWVDLTEVFMEPDGVSFFQIESDSNLNEMMGLLSVGKWYSMGDKEIIENEDKRCIQELLGRSHMRYIRKLQDPPRSIRIITEGKCQELIESLARIRQAETNIADMLFGQGNA